MHIGEYLAYGSIRLTVSDHGSLLVELLDYKTTNIRESISVYNYAELLDYLMENTTPYYAEKIADTWLGVA